MAIFTRYALTRAGQALITKAQAEQATIHFTRAVTGSGLWGEDEDLEAAEALKEPKQSIAFSDISIPDGNPSAVVLTVNICNEEQTELYYLNELAIMAQDPQIGEIVYAIMASEIQAVYVPAYNGIGLSNIVQRINIEVANSSNVTINMDGAHVSAAEYTAWRLIVNRFLAGLSGGSAGNILMKGSDQEYDYRWEETNVIARPKNEFPETGQADAIYVDTDASEIYVWKLLQSGVPGYWKLPLGAEASATLQEQITANANAIRTLQTNVGDLQTKFREVSVTVKAASWTAGTASDGTVKYTQTVTVAGMTASTKAVVWPAFIATDGAALLDEKKAQAIFFGFGKSEGRAGEVLLTCYKKKPAVNFGLKFQGVKEAS